MVLKAITVISVLAAGLAAVFAGAGWIWALLGTFVGTWLGLALIFFLVVVVACALVDPSVPQEEDSPFYRRLMYLAIEAALAVIGVRLETEGLEKTPKDGRFLLVSNHIYDLDPLVLHTCFQKSQLAFITKWENCSMFVVGKLMHKTLCQPINRENDREALKTILKCIQILKKDQASVAVFPEGYTSLDRKLHHFRPGVFKIAQKAGVPIVVCTVQDTYKTFANLKKLKTTKVKVHLLEVIPAQELQGVTTVEIADRVHKLMAEDLGPGQVLED